jgi:leader peptidase (prepilin peptidase)/N-methyltransferase
MEELQPEDEKLLPRGQLVAVAVLSLLFFGGLLLFVPLLAALFSTFLFFTMALITLTDLRHFIIPDVLSLPAIPVGLVAQALVLTDGDWRQGAAGAVIGAGAFYMLRLVYFQLRGIEGLGLGDVKLAAVAGAWLGPAALAPACLVATLAAILGVVLHAAWRGQSALNARAHIPFGSFIAPVIFMFWMAKMTGFDAAAGALSDTVVNGLITIINQ